MIDIIVRTLLALMLILGVVNVPGVLILGSTPELMITLHNRLLTTEAGVGVSLRNPEVTVIRILRDQPEILVAPKVVLTMTETDLLFALRLLMMTVTTFLTVPAVIPDLSNDVLALAVILTEDLLHANTSVNVSEIHIILAENPPHTEPQIMTTTTFEITEIAPESEKRNEVPHAMKTSHTVRLSASSYHPRTLPA